MHPASCLSTGRSSHGDKVTRPEDDYSLPSSAGAKNKLFTMRLHSERKGNSAFSPFISLCKLQYMCNKCIMYYYNNNIIRLCLNTTLFLKVKNSYMFRLANIAIIRVKTKKIKRNAYRSETYKAAQFLLFIPTKCTLYVKDIYLSPITY